jgi:hypothetical protein
VTAGLKLEPVLLQVIAVTAGDEKSVSVVVFPPELPDFWFCPVPHGQLARLLR